MLATAMFFYIKEESPKPTAIPTTTPKPTKEAAPVLPPWESSGLFLPIEAPPEILRDAFFKALRNLNLNATTEVFTLEVPPVEYSEEEIRQILSYYVNFSQIRPIVINWYLPEEVSAEYSKRLVRVISFENRNFSIVFRWKTFHLNESVVSCLIKSKIPLYVYNLTTWVEANNLSNSEISELSSRLSKWEIKTFNATTLWSKRLYGEPIAISTSNSNLTIVTQGAFKGIHYEEFAYTLVYRLDKHGKVVGRKLFNQTFRDVVITDKIYLLGDDLLALDFNGSEVWKLEVNVDILLPLEEGVLALSKDPLTIYYISSTGEILWHERVADWWWNGRREILYLKTLSNRTLAVDMNDGRLYLARGRVERIKVNRIRVSTDTMLSYSYESVKMSQAGKTVWVWQVPKCKRCWEASIAGKVLVDSGRVFLSTLEYYNTTSGCSWNRLVYCLNLSNGEVLWVREVLSNYLDVTELVVHDERLYVTSDGMLYCFSYDGDLLWNKSNGLFVDFSPPIFFYDDIVCSGAIRCFQDNGNFIWGARWLSAFGYIKKSEAGVYLIADMWPDAVTYVYLIETKPKDGS